jgi:FkbM family methyltransferase
MRSFQQKIKDMLLKLGPDSIVLRTALNVHARQHGFHLSYGDKTITADRNNQSMVLSKNQLYLVPIVLECYHEFFDSVEAKSIDGRSVLDFSKPGVHRYKESGVEFTFPGMPEDYSIAGYTHWFKPRPGDLVFDVGAHAGMTGYFLSKMVGPTGRVIAFEPDDINFPYLLENIKGHALDNVEPVKTAMDAKSGHASFNSDGTMGSGLVDHLTYPDTGVHRMVETISLVDATKKYGVPAMIKMDIEGAELVVIEAALEFLRATPLHLSFDSYHRMPNGEFTWTYLEKMFRSIDYDVSSSTEFGQMFTWAKHKSL